MASKTAVYSAGYPLGILVPVQVLEELNSIKTWFLFQEWMIWGCWLPCWQNGDWTY